MHLRHTYISQSQYHLAYSTSLSSCSHNHSSQISYFSWMSKKMHIDIKVFYNFYMPSLSHYMICRKRVKNIQKEKVKVDHVVKRTYVFHHIIILCQSRKTKESYKSRDACCISYCTWYLTFPA